MLEGSGARLTVVIVSNPVGALESVGDVSDITVESEDGVEVLEESPPAAAPASVPSRLGSVPVRLVSVPFGLVSDATEACTEESTVSTLPAEEVGELFSPEGVPPGAMSSPIGNAPGTMSPASTVVAALLKEL